MNDARDSTEGGDRDRAANHPDASAYLAEAIVSVAREVAHPNAERDFRTRVLEAIICERLLGPTLTPADLERIEGEVAARVAPFIPLNSPETN